MDPNVEKHLIRALAETALENVEAVLESLPVADTCELQFVGPGGPLSEATLVVGQSPSESIAIVTDPDGKYLAPIGAPAFKADAIGLAEVTIAAITDAVPRVISMVSLSCAAFVLACVVTAGAATAGELAGGVVLATPSACACGPDCACGDDCRCGELVALAGDTGALKAEAATATDTTTVRRVALRMFLRRQATKALLRGDLAKAKQLRAALGDDDVLDSTVDAIAAESNSKMPVQADGKIVDAIIKFLQWLLDHADEILMIVLRLLPLFLGDQPPAAALLDAPSGWLLDAPMVA